LHDKLKKFNTTTLIGKGCYTALMESLLNKKALHNYEILESFSAGIKLLGTEAKSIRKGQASFEGAYISFRQDGAYVVHLTVPAYQQKNAPPGYTAERERKLLLTSDEMSYLRGKSEEKGLTVIPVKIYTAHGLIKLEIGVARKRKKHDKREVLKKKAVKRDLERDF